MSAETRQEIAAAALTVPAITSCTPYGRTLTKPGDGLVRLAGMTAGANGFGFVGRWQLWIALPQDSVLAEKWLDANHELIAQALDDVWVATTVTPAELVFDAAAINGVIYEGTL